MNELLFLESVRFQTWVRKNRLGSAVAKLRAELAAHPDSGDVIPGGGSLRKVRMAGQGRGKRGGFRVVYVLMVNRAAAVLIDGYSKADKDDLSAEELRQLVNLAAGIEPLAARLVKDMNTDSEGAP